MNDPQADAISWKARLLGAGAMLLVALIASGLLRPDPMQGVLVAFIMFPIFPLGLGYVARPLLRGGYDSDAMVLLLAVASYAVYAALLAALLRVKSMGGLLVSFALLVIVLLLNVKGCADADQIRWFSS